MLKKRIFLFFFMACLTYVHAFAVSEKKTPQGQIYWAYHVPNIDFLTFMITFPFDNTVAKTKNGIVAAHLLSKVLSNGGVYEKDEFGKLQKDLPFDFSIRTHSSAVSVYVRVPKKHLRPIFDVLSNLIPVHPLPQKNVEHAQTQLLSVLNQSQHDPNTLLDDYFFEIFYGDHPYNHDVTFRMIEGIPKVSSADLSTVAQLIFKNNKMVVSVVGDFDTQEWEEVFDLFANHFKVQVDDTALPDPFPHVQFNGLGQHEHKEYDVPQTALMMGVPSIDLNHPDFLALSVGMRIIGGGNSLLFDEIRDKKGLVYYISAWEHGDIHAPALHLRAGFSADKTEEVLIAIKDIFSTAYERISIERIQQELTSLKHAFAFASSSTRQIVASLDQAQQDKRPINWIPTYVDRLSAITPDDVKNALKNHIHTDKILFATLGRASNRLDRKVHHVEEKQNG